MERKSYDVAIKLVGNRKPCHMGHKVGDEWIFHRNTPAGMCSMAFSSLYPAALILKYGGAYPWQKDPDVVEMACPDGEVVNVFELRRIDGPGKAVPRYDVTVKLVGTGNTGVCGYGHRVGDEWTFDEKTPDMCPSAYNALYATATVLKYGGRFPWQQEPDSMTVTCPDPAVLNHFEIRRTLRK